MIDVGALFPAAPDNAYLNTASSSLGNSPGATALRRAVDEWVGGTFDWVAAEGVGEELRRVVAGLLGAGEDELAFVTGASGGASTVASQLPDAGPGANVVVPAGDFVSNFLAWQMLGHRGYEVRLVDDVDGVLSTDAFAELIDARTAVVATSLVQSATGFKVDLDDLKELTSGVRAWLVVDASQALGCVDFDVEGIDALFSCAHKWLCGVRGMGYLYVRSELSDSFRPLTPGWKSAADPLETFYGPKVELADSASKLDASWPWFDPIVNIEGARIIADVGVARIAEHNNSLIDDIESLGFVVPFERSNRSPIVSLDVDDTDLALERFRSEGIVASARAGRVRVSVHLYNTHDDIERLGRALS